MGQRNWVKGSLGDVVVERTPYPGYHFLPKPTKAVLDEFEKDGRFSLPPSYRDFVLTFGAGELAEFFRIAAPLPIESDYNLAAFNRQLHGEPEEQLLAAYGDQAVLDTFYFFCATAGDSFFGWKIDSPTTKQEYPIYEFPGFPPFGKVADTFEEFVTSHILTPHAERGWSPERVFAGFQIAD